MIVEMWRFVFMVIAFLNYDIVNAYYILNTSAVTWRDAQNFCNVPSVNDIMQAEKSNTGLLKTFTAWTSSMSRTSDWASFYGCLDVSVNMNRNEIRRKLNQYFPNSTNATELESVFKCAYFCTTKGIYFTFFRRFCKCIHQNELKSGILKRPVCISTDLRIKQKIDAVYSISRSSLPIFKFETEFWTKSIQTSGTEGIKYKCLTKRQDGTFISNNCFSNNNAFCADGHKAYGTWSYSIHLCLLRNESLMKELNQRSEYWLGYFMYEEDESHQQCTSILRKDIEGPLTYQVRPCSDHLYVLCMDKTDSSLIITAIPVNSDQQIPVNLTESVIDISFKPTSTLMAASDVQKSGAKINTFDLCIKIVAGGTASFATITILLMVIIIIQRKKLTKASYTTLTVRRSQSNYNEVSHEMSDSITGQYYEITPLSDIPAPGCQTTVQQNISQIQHMDTSGYLIPSGMLETSGDYQTVGD